MSKISNDKKFLGVIVKITESRITEIDLLRFFAALAVVFFHYTFRGYAADNMSELSFPSFAPIAKYGYLGVQLFFLISGFVILRSAASGSLRTFIISRIVRLYPAFWICCTLTFVITLVIGGGHFHVTSLQYVSNMTLLSGFFKNNFIDGVYWTLVVEMRFYFLIALVLFFRKINAIEPIMVAWLSITVLWEFLHIHALHGFLVVDYSAWFVSGAIFYLVRSNGVSIARLSTLTVAYGVALFQSIRSIELFRAQYHASLSPLIIFSIVTFFFVVMFLISIGYTNFFSNRRWAAVGALTYPLYLIHENIGFMLFNRFGSSINHYLLLVTVIAAMLLIAYGVNRFVEKPLGKFLRYSVDVWLLRGKPTTAALTATEVSKVGS
jgi:peptidoglycan/LPS O-acetylase OafA/YrhL